MPEADLEAVVSFCAGNVDRKIACETPEAAGGGRLLDDDEKEEEKKTDLPPMDCPPESFWLSKEAEFDWFDRNAFYDRKDSGKGNSSSTNLNPNLNSNNMNLNPNPNPSSSSQRFSKKLKSKAKIIGLPKTQKTSYVDTTKRRNCKPANIQLFPKRSESVGSKSVVEPSSPKVSCMGRVRSKRGRKKQSESSMGEKKSAKNARSVERSRKRTGGCCMAIFRSHRRTAPPPMDSPPRRSVTVKVPDSSLSFEPDAAAPPGLGGMMRFASGRRSASSWTADDSNERTS